MQYLFILGRNPELSIKELEAYFGNFKYEKIGNAVLADLPTLKKGVVNQLGGTIAIGEVLSDKAIFNKNIVSLNIYSTTENKLNYVIWNFSSGEKEFFDEVKEGLKQRFKTERMKTTEKKIANRLKLQTGEEIPNLSSKKLIDEQYFVFENKFGRILETCDYEELERFDMEKPVRREELSISPRLAKIMINLSKIKSGEILVDPFCGIGVIVQEALKRGCSVIGIDKDVYAIDGLNRNLKWAKFSEKNYQLVNKDSSRHKIKNSDVLVTEPDLGEVLRLIPEEEKAKGILRNYEELMISVLDNLKRNIKGRIVFTAPFIKSKKHGKVKRLGCNNERILERTRLRLVSGFPLTEFREDQIVGREIFVLEY